MKIRRGTFFLADLAPGPSRGNASRSRRANRSAERGRTPLHLDHPVHDTFDRSVLRVSLPRNIAGNREDCEVMIDQSRAIDNRRFVRAVKLLPPSLLQEVEQKLRLLGEL